MIEKYIINEECIVKDAIFIIQSNKSRSCIVVNNQNKVLDVITEGDVLRLILNDISIYSKLSEIIDHKFIFLKEKNIEQAIKYFKNKNLSILPVIDSNYHLDDVITINEILELI